MKQILFSVLLFFIYGMSFGQCPTTEVVLTTQAEVDAFIVNYPSCTNLDEILQITNGADIVNLNGLSNLVSAGPLMITNNPILDDLNGLSNLTSVVWFTIAGNDNLTSLQGLNNLTTATSFIVGQPCRFSDNPLLSDITALSKLVDIDVLIVDNNDSLVTLDGLQSLSDINFQLDIQNNDVLSDISSLENTTLILFALTISNNPQLASCGIASICNYMNGSGAFVVSNNAPGCNTVLEVDDACNNAFSEIKGQVFFDFDINGCTVDDYPSGGILVNIENATISKRVSTGIMGNYSILVEPDTYSVSIVSGSLPAYYAASPGLIDVTFIGYGEVANADFCLEETESVTDVSIVAIPLQLPRPGFEVSYNVLYKNIGTTTQSGEITFNFDDNLMQYVTATQTPSATTVNSLVWSYIDLLPFESRFINVRFSVFPPPTVQGGETLVSNLQITTISTDDFQDNNYFELREDIVNSYDPNDKQVLQGSEIAPEEAGEYLDYIVRFQNTGTASAITVRIDDVLSNNLEWNSFKPLHASHSYTTQITDENDVSFLFENINLPTESQDAVGSNGYIAFKVRSDMGLPLGSTIENTASIYFDFNRPIITNTVITTVAEPLSIEDFLLKGISVYPNPASDRVGVVIKDSEIEMIGMQLFSITGQQLIHTMESIINLKDLQDGIYFIKITTTLGTATRKIVKKS